MGGTMSQTLKLGSYFFHNLIQLIIQGEILLKILISVPSLCIGGAEQMVTQLVEHIDSDKNNVKLIVLSAKQGTHIEDELENEDIDIVYLNKEIGPSINAIIKATKIAQKFNPDIIHTHLSSFFYLVPYARMYGVKILHTVHSKPIYEAKGIRRSILNYFYKKNIGIPVAISDLIGKEVSEVYKLNLNSIEIVYNPVDIKRFSIESNQRHDDAIIFINIARFVEPKNHLELIQAFKEVNERNRNTRLLLLGDGLLRNRIENKIKELNLESSVELKGNVPNVEYYLAKSDVFVLPSAYEGLPLTILEAMASGLPIIATSVGGVPDIVNKNGILTKPGNSEQLVHAMIELAENKELRYKMGEISKIEVQKYDISKVTSKYEKLYKKYGKSK